MGAAGAEEAQHLEAHRPEGARGGAHAARLAELALGLRVVAPLQHTQTHAIFKFINGTRFAPCLIYQTNFKSFLYFAMKRKKNSIFGHF